MWKHNKDCYKITIDRLNHIKQLFSADGKYMYCYAVIHQTYKRFTMPLINMYQTLLQEYRNHSSSQKKTIKKNLAVIYYNGGPIAAIIKEINMVADALAEENVITTNKD